MKLPMVFLCYLNDPKKRHFLSLIKHIYNKIIWIGTEKVWRGLPWKASTKRITVPFVESKIVLPSGLNFRPVHSQPFSGFRRKDANGPLSKERKSYNLTLSEFTPAAKMSPSGSNAATGRLDRCIRPWQLGDLRSHNRRVLSIDPERNMSSTGDIDSATTL